MLKEDVLSPYENNNKVLITNDYGNLDYSFLEEYTTDTATNSSGDLIVTDTSGKLDNSFLYSTNSKKANSVVITDASGLINYNLLKASTTPTASYIPIASNTGKLNNNWLNIVSSSTGTADKDKLVLTGSNGKINNNLLNASTSPAANTIPLSDSNKKISDSWLNTTTTSKPDTILKLDNTGKIDSGVIPTGLFLPLTGGDMTGSIVINGTGSNTGRTLANLKATFPNFIGISANCQTDGFLIGMTGTSGTGQLVIATHDNGNEPIYVRQYGGDSGYINMPNNIKHEITLMDANGYTAVLKLTSDSDITSTNGGLNVKTNIQSTNGNLSIAGTSTLTGNVTIGNSSKKTGNLTVYGSTSLQATTIYDTLVLSKTTDLSGTANNSPALIIGGTATQKHIEIDNNEIQAKTNATSVSSLGINEDGGDVYIGSDAQNTVVTLRKNATITGTASITGNTTIGNSSTKSTLNVYGAITGNNGLTVKGAALDAQAGAKTTTLQATGNTTIGGTLGVAGASTFNGKTSVVNNNLIVNNGLIRMIPSGGTRESTVAMVTNTGDHGGVGDDVYYGLGGNCTFIFGGDAYGAWNSYLTDHSITTIVSDGLWPVKTVEENNVNKQYIVGKGGRDDNIWLISDRGVHIQTNIGDNTKDKNGNITAYAYRSRKDFYFGTDGSLSIPGSLSVTSSITSGSLTTGPLSATAVTSTGDITATGKTVTADNFKGKWADYTNSIGTKVTPTSSSNVVIKDGTTLKYATISDLATAVSIAKESLATNGYVKFSNGFVIEWTSTSTETETARTWNLPLPLSAVYYAGWQPYGTGYSTSNHVNMNEYAVSSITITATKTTVIIPGTSPSYPSVKIFVFGKA